MQGCGLKQREAQPRVARLPLSEARAPSQAEPDPKGPSLPLPPMPIFAQPEQVDRKSTRLNSSHSQISYAVFCLKKKKKLDNQAYAEIQNVTPIEIRAAPLSVLSLSSIVMIVPLRWLDGWLALSTAFDAQYTISV